MSTRGRVVAVVKEVSKLLLPVVRSLPHRLDDRRRELARELEQQAPRATGLLRESALSAAKSLRAPIISG